MDAASCKRQNGGKKYEKRLRQIEEVLHVGTEPIDYDELRASCSYGIPENLRPLAWRILLNYLPKERETWKLHLKGLRSTYDSLIADLIIKPISEGKLGNDDHPLSQNPGSEWNSYFRDNEVLLQIDKDVRRLYPEIDFFQRATAYPHKEAMLMKLSERITQEGLKAEVVDPNKSANFIERERRKSAKPHQEDAAEGSETHWQVVERILFIYSKLNTGIKYIQGMNEVIGPIYYVFASDQDREWAAYAEADTYYCFQLLMSEIKDNFIKSLDNSHFGIDAAMMRFHNRLATFDPELHSYLVNTLSVKPQFYVFRWLSLMLSQEFPLPDVITIWDALFSDGERFVLLDDVMLAMLEMERDTLLNEDFGNVLRLLQNYPEIDVLKLVRFAYSIRDGLYTPPKQESPKLSAREQFQEVKNGVTTLISSKLKSFSFKKS